MLKKLLFPVVPVVASLILSGCDQIDSTKPLGSNDTDSAAEPQGEVIAKVNGQAITEDTLAMISQANRRSHIPREKLIDDLVKHELLYQEAVSKNLENNPDVSKRLRFLKRSVLSQAAMQDYITNHPISDEDIQKAYDEQFGGTGAEEFKARHILTKTEDEAKEVIKKLKAGGKFEELAKKHSTGPTGPKGGDLGWFSPQQMVAPFSEAVSALSNGKYTTEPVKTQFGWHVILRENSRSKTAPPMASMKANIQAKLQRSLIEKHLESLKSNAKIEIVPEEKTEQPAKAAAATPVPPASTSPKPADTPAKDAKPAQAATENTEAPAK